MRIIPATLALALVAALSLAGTGCGTQAGPSQTAAPSATATDIDKKTSTLPREQILSARAEVVLSSIGGQSGEFPDNLITKQQLQARLQDPSWPDSFFLLDTSPKNEWDQRGHIDGASWIRMQDVADAENLDRLPRDRKIICISPTGHTAVQVAAVLRWLGYDAAVLKHGMAGWTDTPEGKLMLDDVQGGVTGHYPVAMELPYSPPVSPEPSRFLSIPDDREIAVLEAAARLLLKDDVFEKEYPFNHIFTQDLYGRLTDPAQRDALFLLDIRPLDIWQRDGHIDMGDHLLIDWRILGAPENLAKLPKDKLIVVLGATGQTAGQVTPLLRMLGYNAVTLRSGMTAWTSTPDSQETLDTITSANYPVVK